MIRRLVWTGALHGACWVPRRSCRVDGGPGPLLSCSVLSASVTLWAVAHQVPFSMGFLRQEYWSRLPFPSPGDLPKPGIKPVSPVSLASQVDFLPAEQLGKLWEKQRLRLKMSLIPEAGQERRATCWQRGGRSFQGRRAGASALRVTWGGMGWDGVGRVGGSVYSECLCSRAIRFCCLSKEAAGKRKRENSRVD